MFFRMGLIELPVDNIPIILPCGHIGSKAVIIFGQIKLSLVYFNAKLFQDGTALRSYLAKKLTCDPMRVTRSFSSPGHTCIGLLMT